MDWLKRRIAAWSSVTSAWFNENFTFKGLLVAIVFAAKEIPDAFGRKDFWSTHLVGIWRLAFAHSTIVVTLLCALFILLDHRRVLSRRAGGDPRSLKNRTIKLRDDLQDFLREIDLITVTKDLREGNPRWEKLLHGYELRFAEDVRKICHELGEAGFHDATLLLATERSHQTRESCSDIIGALSKLGTVVEDADRAA